MKLKEKVINILKAKKGQVISGAFIAKECNVSRNSVWLTINILKKEGYKIDCYKNKGYLLQADFAKLQKEEILANLGKGKNGYSFILLDTVDSTNTYLKKNMDNDCPEWTVVIAEEQTAGRGRMNRPFYSPKFGGIYMSILLRPQVALQDMTKITTASAVALCQTIENLTDKIPKIKWINDVFIEDKKVAGILTESSLSVEQAKIDYVIVGVGVNLHAESLAEEVQEIATAMYDSKNYEHALKAKFIAEFLCNLKKQMQYLEKNTFFEAYKERMFLFGHKICVHVGDKKFDAVVKDLRDDYSLVVTLEDGQTKVLHSGEVSIKPYN